MAVDFRYVAMTGLLVAACTACTRSGFDGSADGSATLDVAPSAERIAPDEGTFDVRDLGSPVPLALAAFRLDEASSGQTPPQLLDHMPSPVHMALTYDGKTPVFDQGQGGARHLRFDGASTGGGFAAIAGTKFDAIHLSRAATIEAKFRLDDCTSATDQQRIVGLGDGDEGGNNGWFALRAWDKEFGIVVSWNKLSPALFYGALACPAGALVVQHWVVDSDNPVAEERVRAYQSGARLSLRLTAFTGGTPGYPSQGDRIFLGPGTRALYLGRAHSSARAAKSRIYFAAIYDRALTEAQIKLRTAQLLTSDD